MSPEDMYDLVMEATRQVLREEQGEGTDAVISRLSDGHVSFVDGEGRTVKNIPVATLLSKVTSVRERLRVLEQKLNNNAALSASDKSDLQGYITKCYGSLTTFNFLFRDEADKFKGSGGR
ncbi:MAG: hypothetical protein AB8H79_24015 [Myxococcota bacterium]